MLSSSPVMATIPVVDLARAIAFYSQKLGLATVESNEHMATLAAGSGSRIFMYQRAETKADHTAATFEVEDVDHVVDGLIQNGVMFEQYDFGGIKTDARGVMRTDGGKIAWLKDTEGNILSIASMETPGVKALAA